jgi:hypothetical protein
VGTAPGIFGLVLSGLGGQCGSQIEDFRPDS